MDTQLGKDRKIEEIGIYSDTRDILAHARQEAERAGIDDWFIVDVDAHHMESISWAEIVQHIEDPVIRDQAVRFQKERVGAPPYGINADLGLRYQDVGGRIPHQLDMRETVEDIQPDLLIPTGRRKGQNPSLSSIYRALAEYEKTQAYPEAVDAAHADFTALQQRDRSPV